jgi:hypothetical protein
VGGSKRARAHAHAEGEVSVSGRADVQGRDHMRGKAWMASRAREEGRNSGTCLDRAGAAAGLSGACGSDDLDGGRVLVKKGEEDVAEGACAGRRKESRVCARAGA